MSEILQYIDKFVFVTLVDKTIVSGECYSVDPITKTLVLICNVVNTSRFCVTIILAHAIDKINSILEMPSIFKSQKYIKYKEHLVSKIYKNNSKVVVSEKTLQHKEILLSWLEKNHLPVAVNGNILSVVNGIVLIEPPYTVECCRGTNTIVLDRIMKMIKSCPGLDD